MAAPTPVPTRKGGSIAGGILLILAGLAVLLLFGDAGLQMITLQSQAGNTVAEAYYNAVGWATFGLGLFCTCTLWALAGIVARK